MSNATVAGSTGEGLIVMGSLWQNYGGAYGDYCVLINIATILLLKILRSSNWLPWLQSSLSSWLLSSAKLEWDGLALWQTGSMATHHQYLVVFCVFGAARRRLELVDVTQASTHKVGWFASLERLLSRARSYTLLVVISSQYNAVSTCCLAAGIGMLVVSRAYEVYYPWLVSIHSQQSCLEQMRRAMVDLQRNVQLLDDSGYSTGVPWPVPSFCNTTHTRLMAFRAHISSNYGIFMPCNLQAHSARDSSSLDYPLIYFGWVDGSCLMTSFSMLLALFMCWGLSTSQTSPLTWRLAGGLLHLLCFCSLLFLNIPAVIYQLSKLAETLIIDSCENDRLIIYSQEWWAETKRFLGVLVRHGLPSQEQLSVLGSRSGACLSSVVGRLEGLEFAVYVLLAALMKLFTEGLLCRAVLLLKRLGLGHTFLLLCQRMKSKIVTRLVMVKALFPGLINSVAITILKAETALASQKICLGSGLCVQALDLEPGLFTRLETVVQHKGAIEESCKVFLHTRAESSHMASYIGLEDPFLARAVALGLLQQAECCLHKLQGSRTMRHVVGASFLQDLLWLVRVYAMDSYVSNAKTRDAMLGAARVVREVVEEALEAHWQHYKGRERSVEANFCECVSEGEWSIMTAQASVELLLVYMGLRISSLEWPYPQQEARVLKDWIATRSGLITGAEVRLVY